MAWARNLRETNSERYLAGCLEASEQDARESEPATEGALLNFHMPLSLLQLRETNVFRWSKTSNFIFLISVSNKTDSYLTNTFCEMLTQFSMKCKNIWQSQCRVVIYVGVVWGAVKPVEYEKYWRVVREIAVQPVKTDLTAGISVDFCDQLWGNAEDTVPPSRSGTHVRSSHRKQGVTRLKPIAVARSPSQDEWLFIFKATYASVTWKKFFSCEKLIMIIKYQWRQRVRERDRCRVTVPNGQSFERRNISVSLRYVVDDRKLRTVARFPSVAWQSTLGRHARAHAKSWRATADAAPVPAKVKHRNSGGSDIFGIN